MAGEVSEAWEEEDPEASEAKEATTPVVAGGQPATKKQQLQHSSSRTASPTMLTDRAGG